jgi:hypothetical protein
MLLSSFCTEHQSSVSIGFTEQIMPILRILCYNGSLVIRKVVSLTTVKFKPLIFSVWLHLVLYRWHVHSHRVRVRVRVTLRLAVYRQSVRLGAEPLVTHSQNFFSQLHTCYRSPITSSRTRGWVCHLQLLLALASLFILVSESRGTRDHILLSQIRDFPLCHLLRVAGLRWRHSTPPPHGNHSRKLTAFIIAARTTQHRSHCSFIVVVAWQTVSACTT